MKFYLYLCSPKECIMTLIDLIKSVNSEQYSDNPLYQKLRNTKPEYGYLRRIKVKEENGQLKITNTHIGSLGDILTYVIEVTPELNISKVQLLDAILKEMSKESVSEQEGAVFWNDFDRSA